MCNPARVRAFAPHARISSASRTNRHRLQPLIGGLIGFIICILIKFPYKTFIFIYLFYFKFAKASLENC